MFSDEIYEVERDDFRGFIAQIKPESFTYNVKSEGDEKQEMYVTSTDGERMFAKVVSTPEEAHYYVYEMPLEEERRPAPAVRKITLETKEEVQAMLHDAASL